MSRAVDTTATPRPRRRLVRLAALALLAHVLAWVVNRSLRRVEGTSMLPSLWPGDLLVTVPARLVAARGGDVVVADLDGRRVTKRLAAPVGGRVDLRDGHVLADGTWWTSPDTVPVDEDASWPPAPGRAVLLGDHRARSTDARTVGTVPVGAIDRVALVRLRPLRWLRARSGSQAGTRIRRGVRLVVLDPDDRVLLFRVTDADGGDATWWEAPGGGCRPGEPPHAAAARELAEEVGARDLSLEPLGEVHVRRTTLAGAALEKVEDLFAVRVPGPKVDRDGWTPSEVRDIAEVRWWTHRELAAAAPGEVVPGGLARLATRASRII